TRQMLRCSPHELGLSVAGDNGRNSRHPQPASRRWFPKETLGCPAGGLLRSGLLLACADPCCRYASGYCLWHLVRNWGGPDCHSGPDHLERTPDASHAGWPGVDLDRRAVSGNRIAADEHIEGRPHRAVMDAALPGLVLSCGPGRRGIYRTDSSRRYTGGRKRCVTGVGGVVICNFSWHPDGQDGPGIPGLQIPQLCDGLELCPGFHVCLLLISHWLY